MFEVDGYIPYTVRPPRGSTYSRVTYHPPEGGKRIIKRYSHPFDERLVDRRYWLSLLERRKAHVCAALTRDETLWWSTSAPRPELVYPEALTGNGLTVDSGIVRTLLEAGQSIDPETQLAYPWALVSSVTTAEAFRFGGFYNLIAPRNTHMRLATPYGSGDIIHFTGTLDEFVIQFGDQLRLANT